MGLCASKLGVSLSTGLTRLQNVPVLVIDAQADETILSAIFHDRGRDWSRFHIKRDAEIVQVSDAPVSKTKLREDDGLLDRIADFAKSAGKDVLLVMPKQASPKAVWLMKEYLHPPAQ